MPSLTVGDAKVRVVAGEAYGARSPVSANVDLFYVDAHIPMEGRLPLPAVHEQRAAYVVDGALKVGDATAQAGEILVFEAGVDLELNAPQETHVVLFGGAPLDVPRYVWWNYVASDEAFLKKAQQAWRDDALGHVEGDPERIPLPENRPSVRLFPE